MRLTRNSGRTKSEILREALHYLAAEQTYKQPEGPYEMISDLIGIAEDGPINLAREHKKAFYEALPRKAPRQ